MSDTLFPLPPMTKDPNQKRRWENAFQKWSNEQSQDGHTPEGCCGTGTLCDYCEDNTFGRPRVRALNALCRTEKKQIDYTDYDFSCEEWERR